MLLLVRLPGSLVSNRTEVLSIKQYYSDIMTVWNVQLDNGEFLCLLIHKAVLGN